MTRPLVAMALSAALAAPLAAQTPQEICRGAANISVGFWAEYQVNGQMAAQMGGTSGGAPTLRHAVVGTEAVEGDQFYWVEMKMSMPMGDAIVQMLIPGWPFEQADVRAMVMKMGSQPAMRMSQQMMDMMRQQMPDNPTISTVEGCESADVVGWESVTVPAGTFRALHIRPEPKNDIQADVWVTLDVPFGFVKAVFTGGREGGEIVLAAHGKDARSSITETPREMPGMRE